MHRCLALCFCWSCWLCTGVVAPSTPSVHGGIVFTESEQVLAPGNPVNLKLAIGEAKFVHFDCENGPADAVISLKTYSETADPLLFLSADPDKQPRFADNDGSSFAHWLGDSSGLHYAIAKGVNPRGGMLGLFNMRKFASEELNAVLTLRCSWIIAFDGLFWDHLRTNEVCPVGIALREDGTEEEAGAMCSGHGKCEQHGECLCDSGHTGPACEYKTYDVVVNQDFNFELAVGQYQYFRVRVPSRFPGGYVQVFLKSSTPLVVLLRRNDLPSKNDYDSSNFDDWLNHRNQTDIKLKVTASDGVTAAPTGGAHDIGGPPPAREDNDGVGNNYGDDDAGVDSKAFGAPRTGEKSGAALGLGSRRLEALSGESRFVFVGIYHHRRYGATVGASVRGNVDIALRQDEFFVSEGGEVPTSWTSDLYDNFHDLRNVEYANSEAYPDGEQFMYDLEIKHEETVHQEVRLFSDRLTLLHLNNVHQLKHMSLTFRSGPKITHVLTASMAAPKTLFDFDDQAPQGGAGLNDMEENKFVIHAHNRQNIWCAIFSKANGYTQITSVAYGSSDGDSASSSGFAVLLVFCLACCLAGGLRIFSDGDEPGASLLERLGNMGGSRWRAHESSVALASLTQGGSSQGFSGSDIIDQSMEDQYLHRGGLGDEGL
eukprot:TRINITY_DN42878_c0_g1_i1.p1 TRINITY_DN42878_c0_g1~~TRINITY_DN42878_c0_g1_i1.p1  ORF type:complete len:656 (+),score=105.40 TRINITY_DN42878_c0_g1_i1:21-1988(+)